ncbi:MAG TPA: HAD-IIIC family phosphatase, partial [Thermoleophilaceae bacterium]|nr:HAD-IIIC family phosphatase [Thermoleophilaceae bacterium]
QALNPSSELYADGPDGVLLIPAAEDVLAELFDDPGSASDQTALVDERLAEIEASVTAILDRLPAATCHVVAYGADRAPVEHVLDPGDPARGQGAVDRWVDGLRGLSRLSPRVVIVDWERHVRRIGSAGLTDPRLWYLGRMRLNPDGLAELAELTARQVAAYRGGAHKVAVVDLDGTLWGGVVGEAGVSGLELGQEGAGLAFRDFQAELARLRATGIVLAVSSKNNRDEAVEAIETHPAMALRLSDFAAERINWADKATSLREMAQELNLGLDSFVFLDDNPVERDWVRQALPEVTVPDLPEDPAHRPAFLRECGLFDRIVLTDADTARAQSYAAQGSRTRLREGSMSFEDFLRSLEQEVTIEAVGDATLERAAQLCQRTNQFNLTTRRHTAADIERMMASDTHQLYTLAVSDRFGQSGVTGLAILELDGADATIDTLLLSCRVLGRRVEDAFLSFLADRARAGGARTLVGMYVPTDRNGQTAGFFPDRGFEDAGEGRFALDLTESAVPMPAEMDVRVGADA